MKPCTKRGKSRRILHQELAVPKALSPNSCMERLLGGRNVTRKLATTERDDRSLERIVRSNRFNNLVEITRECQDHGVTVSRATIHRRLQEMGYRSRIPVTKPLLNSRQKQKRLVWSTERKNWMVARWTKVLFTDESKFCITFGNKGPRVWRLPGEENQPGCTKSSVKFPQSVMVLVSDGGWWCWTTLFPEV